MFSKDEVSDDQERHGRQERRHRRHRRCRRSQPLRRKSCLLKSVPQELVEILDVGVRQPRNSGRSRRWWTSGRRVGVELDGVLVVGIAAGAEKVILSLIKAVSAH